MGSQPESWLRSAAAAGTPAVLLAEEGVAGRGARFDELDGLTAQIVGRMLGGERIAQLGGVRETPTVQLLPVTPAQRRDLEESFAVERQQAKGAWFLPEHVSLRIGLANLPYHFRRQPRFAMTAVMDEGAKVHLAGSPDAVFLWAVLEPLCEALFEQALETLGVAGDALGRMRFGGGWSQLRAHEQVDARQHLLGALARVPPETLCAKFRAARLLSLLGRYADKAKKGPPTKQQVLTKEIRYWLSSPRVVRSSRSAARVPRHPRAPGAACEAATPQAAPGWNWMRPTAPRATAANRTLKRRGEARRRGGAGRDPGRSVATYCRAPRPGGAACARRRSAPLSAACRPRAAGGRTP